MRSPRKARDLGDVFENSPFPRKKVEHIKSYSRRRRRRPGCRRYGRGNICIYVGVTTIRRSNKREYFGLDRLFTTTSESKKYEKTLESLGFQRFSIWLREEDSNFRPSGYEPDELPLLHPAIYRAPQRSHSIPHYTTKSQVFFSIYSILFPARYSPPRKAGVPKASRKKLCPFCPPSCRNGRGVV